MKQKITGIVLFVMGFIGILTLTTLSVMYPIVYNGIYGVGGFLPSTDTYTFMRFSIILCVVGLLILIFDFILEVIKIFKK